LHLVGDLFEFEYTVLVALGTNPVSALSDRGKPRGIFVKSVPTEVEIRIQDL